MNAPLNEAIVLFAHGARDPEWARPFQKIRSAVMAQRPGIPVELAFLEFMQPPLPATVTRLIQSGHLDITVAPLFMAQGGHLKSDVPRLLDALRAAHPEARLRLLPAVGDVEEILTAISAWVVAASAQDN